MALLLRHVLFSFMISYGLSVTLQPPSASQLHSMITRHSQDIAHIMEDTKTLLQQHDTILDAVSTVATTDFHAKYTRGISLGVSPNNQFPSNCVDIKSFGHSPSSLYTVYLPSQTGYGWPQPITVYCDMSTNHGAWITFLRQSDKNGDFPNRTWEEYKYFFGNPLGSFWLGLESLYQLTSNGHWKLRVDLEDWEGTKNHTEYSYFRIGSEKEGYRLYVSGYSGNAGGGLRRHNGQKFSTIDRDNDVHSTISCSQRYKQAWWYEACVTAALTGEYYEGGEHKHDHQGVYWRYWKGTNYSYKKAEMMMMPVV